MTKKQFIKELYDGKLRGKTTCQKELESILDGITELIVEKVNADEKVCIAGFGIFKSYTSKEHNARNPQTGEMMVVPAKRSLKFKSTVKL